MTNAGGRLGPWDRFERFRDHHIRTPLIGRSWISFGLAVFVAVVTAIYFRPEFEEAYSAIRVSLPAAMIAIVGFVITALSILLSVGNANTTGGYIAKERPDGWRLIVRQVSGAAKLAGFLAILVAVEPILRGIARTYFRAELVNVAWLGLFTMFSTLIALNMLRVIWLLERTSAPLPKQEGK